MNKRASLWSQMDELIKSEELSAEEKEILSDAKAQLNNNVDDEKVAAQLKSRLSFLSIKGSLSATVVPFFTELSRLYLGYGRRGNISIN